MLLFVIVFPNLVIAAVNVPDVYFRSQLSALCGITFDKSNNITNPEKAAAIERLDVSSGIIINLSGIEAFTGLLYLDCRANHLTSLDVSRNSALIELHCSRNQLTRLDVSDNRSLKLLNCSANRLASLNVSGADRLDTLQCSNNHLLILDVSGNSALKELYCSRNQLTSLDVSSAPALTELMCCQSVKQP